MWLVALEELRRDSGDDRCYKGAGDSRPEAQQVGGAIYARNLIQHQLAEIGRLTDAYQDTYSDSYGSYIWRPLTELPMPAKREKHLRDRHFVDHLQGCSALDTMRDMIAFLTRV